MTKVDSADATTSSIRELTIRGVILGGVITLIFTAANVYLGLKVGLTFATAIPAAVISMAILRYFRGHTILENNIVQTIASAAGTLAAIIFVLPGLIMIGWWTGFPYWITVAVCIVGGILGVMYSVPLRRALVTGSDLPYPEGVAAAEVLKVGEAEVDGGEGNKRSLIAILVGSLVAAGFSLLAAMKVILNEVSTYFRVGSGGSMLGASLSLALIGVGHLVGVTVGLAMVVGLVISFFVLLPTLTWGNITDGTGVESVEKIVSSTFSTDVRFVGAGAIAIAAIWTLLKIIGPIVKGIRAAAASTRARRDGGQVELMERDLPIWIVGGTIVASLIPICLLLWWFLDSTQVTGNKPLIIVVTLVFVILIGALLASVAGYMAGLIGSSNSPISGLGILVVIIASVVLVLVHGRSDDPAQTLGLVAYALFATAVVFGIATISNDNLQDLKTGQLVGATPWKQQVALVIGVIFGGLVIAPVLDLLNGAFGFAGAPNAGENALAAPQAALISSLAKGVFGGDLNWKLLGLGVAIGAVVIVVDEVLKKTTRFSLPPLAVGMGMYLPMSLTLVIPIGALLGRSYDKWADRTGGADVQGVEQKKRLGVLMATGLIVGESLFGVAFAGIVAASGSDSPLAVVGESFASWAEILGVVLFVAVVAGLYKWTRRTATVEPV
ncbi:oligopeptide transporter, OPT family [soil metagenome]